MEKPLPLKCVNSSGARRHKTANPRLFGSAARGDDRDDIDLDLLIDALPGASLFDLGELKFELESLLGVTVDVVVADSLRPGLREEILAGATPL